LSEHLSPSYTLTISFAAISHYFDRNTSDKISNLEKYSLFRYYGKTGEYDKDNNRSRSRTPLLIVYAFINRHYILDLLPGVSAVGSLLRQGFDIFATDWGTPSSYDKDLTIGHFVNSYMDRSVDLIREITKSDKISLFGYCWGGNLVLMYAALHPDKVKNVITVAIPGDFSVDDTLLSIWTKDMKVDTLLNIDFVFVFFCLCIIFFFHYMIMLAFIIYIEPKVILYERICFT